MTPTDVVGALTASGGRQLPDVFMFPVEDSGRRRLCFHSAVRPVTWRGEERPFYVRSAAPPFDIVPLRRGDRQRAGIWFSVGPGFSGETLRDQVLLIQIEGERTAVARHREVVDSVVEPLTRGVARSLEDPGEPDWQRYCLAAVLPEGDR